MSKRVQLPPGPVCLGVVKHPAIGIRIPELFLPGIIGGYVERNVAGGLMLSFGRETAPEKVIRARPGTWEITRGHTGTSIKKYQTMGAKAALKAGIPVEIEADHLIIIGSSTAAVQRIAGYHAESHISEEELQASLDYNKQAIDEAAKVGVVGCFTTDTSDLFWLHADELSAAQVKRLFEERFKPDERRKILARYRKPRQFKGADGRKVSVTISRTQAMRLALKFQKSLEINARVYRYCRRALGRREFSFEISLDETADMTDPRETLFYLTEWKAMGLPCHYFAPNIGFGKRADYRGDLDELQKRVRQHHAISWGVSRALLSIHSGSGTTPYSGKGRGTYEAILAGTGGNVKYKISGVYFELLMELLAAQPPRSDARKLYNRIFDEVHRLLKRELRTGGPLAQPLLVKQMERYERAIARDAKKKRDPRADFFRFNSYLALNMRDDDGRRYFRDGLIELLKNDDDLRATFDDEVKALTLRLIDGLQFADNLS
ncbi:MAG: hypothetical protein J7M38_02760 [Armatimonadetes bacterium]|nr:hypothetical protein [Armatimonadota bacterium]